MVQTMNPQSVYMHLIKKNLHLMSPDQYITMQNKVILCCVDFFFFFLSPDYKFYSFTNVYVHNLGADDFSDFLR